MEADERRAPGWKRDPFGRFYGRYWDGERWTDRVADEDRTASTDPPGPAPAAVAPPSPPPPKRATPVAVLAERMPAVLGRAWKTWQLAAVAAVALVLGIGIGGAGQKNQPTTVRAAAPSTAAASRVTQPPLTQATTRPTSAPTTAPPTTAAGPKTTFGNGQYRVGTDIAPGTYVAPGGSGCYWERQSTFGGGGVDSIIANDLSRGGQVVVTIAASDKGFKTSGCGTWAPS